MKFQFPAIVFYVDNLPKGMGGCANAFIVRILEKYRNDEGLHQHELFHVRNWWANTILSLVVLMVPSFFLVPQPWIWAVVPLCLFVDTIFYIIPQLRLWEEAEAYKIQLKYPPATTDRDRYAALYAKFISEDYGLSISQEEALKKMT